MEKTAESNKDKATIICGTKRKFEIQDEQWQTLKRSKLDEKSDITKGTKGGARRVSQPIYEVAGQSHDNCLEENPVFIKWVEENLPSKHRNSNGVHRISIASPHENSSYKTKSMSNIRAVQSAFKGTKIVNSQSLQMLAEKHSLTNGKWMFYGKTGNDIDQLWRSVTNGVIQGTIPTFCAKVSAARKENDNHVICIYNNNFLNERDIFALRDGIRNAGIEKPLEYKANIFTHLGIYRNNEWGIDPVLYRDVRGKFQSLFDLSYDKDASKSAVAGIMVKMKSSTLLSISGPIKKCQYPITLGIKSISPIIKYRGRWNDDVRVSVLFHDGNTCMRGVAFGAAALKFERKLKVGRTYKFRYYKIGVHDKRYSNTKYRIHLRENTTTKKIETGYAYIPKEKD